MAWRRIGGVVGVRSCRCTGVARRGDGMRGTACGEELGRHDEIRDNTVSLPKLWMIGVGAPSRRMTDTRCKESRRRRPRKRDFVSFQASPRPTKFSLLFFAVMLGVLRILYHRHTISSSSSPRIFLGSCEM